MGKYFESNPTSRRLSASAKRRRYEEENNTLQNRANNWLESTADYFGISTDKDEYTTDYFSKRAARATELRKAGQSLWNEIASSTEFDSDTKTKLKKYFELADEDFGKHENHYSQNPFALKYSNMSLPDIADQKSLAISAALLNGDFTPNMQYLPINGKNNVFEANDATAELEGLAAVEAYLQSQDEAFTSPRTAREKALSLQLEAQHAQNGINKATGKKINAEENQRMADYLNKYADDVEARAESYWKDANYDQKMSLLTGIGTKNRNHYYSVGYHDLNREGANWDYDEVKLQEYYENVFAESPHRVPKDTTSGKLTDTAMWQLELDESNDSDKLVRIYRDTVTSDDFKEWYNKNRYADKNTTSDKFVGAVGQYFRPDEMLVYKYLSEQENRGVFETYKMLLEPVLTQRSKNAVTEDVEGLATEYPFATSVASGFAKYVGGISSLPEMLKNTIEGKPTDAGSVGFVGSSVASSIRDTVKHEHTSEWFGGKKVPGLGNVGNWVYDTVMSMEDSMISAMFGTALGKTVGGYSASKEAINKIASVTTSAVMGSQVASDTFVQGKVEGYTNEKALSLAVIRATIEGLTEKYSIETILNADGNWLKRMAKSSLAEGSEEVASNWLNAVVDVLADGENVITDKLKEYRKSHPNASKGEALSNAILMTLGEDVSTFLAGAVSGGGMSVFSSGNNGPSGLTANEEKVVNKLYEDALAEMQKDGTKLSNSEKKKLYYSITEDMSKGQLKIDDIESVLGGDTYKKYQDVVKSEDAILKEYERLGSKQNPTLAEQSRYNDLKAKVGDINSKSNRRQLKKQLSEEVFGLVQGDKTGRLAESYKEVARKGQAFEADLTKYKGKQKEAVQRAIDSGVLNNTYRSHELVNILSKIEADKGIVFNYADNAKLKESGFAVEGKTVNGFMKDGAVTLNIQSSKSWQSVVGHEITHVLEGTDAYSELQKALYAYAESKGELANRRGAITELYKGMNADIDAELTADLVGDYLFSDKEFINHLTTNRNLFQKIYDEIKYLYKVATGKEQKEIAKVKREFDKAWKGFADTSGQKNNTAENSGVKYSIKNTSELTLKEQLNLFYNSKLKSSDALYFGTTPSALEKAGLSNLPLAFGQKDFKKSTNIKHNTPRRVIKKLNVSLSEPILSFAYGNRIGVLTSDVDADGKPVLVAIEKNVMMDREPVNAIRSVYGLDNPKEWIKNQIEAGKEFVLYNEKRANSFLQTYGYKASVEEGIKLLEKSVLPSAKIIAGAGSKALGKTLSKYSISNDNGNVKHSLSFESDAEYLYAVESGDTDTAKRLVDEAAEAAMKDSKIRDSEGKLQKVYHGSNSADFYEFDKQRRGQTDSSMYGRGYYFAFDADYSSDFGENIREFYLDIKNPYYIDINAPASKIANFLKSKGVKVDFDYSNMKSHYFAKNFGSQKFTDTLVDLGYDGVIVRTDEGGYFEAVAFHRNQMKLADAVTYDDEGNVIPISERFDTANKDVRYSINEADDIAPIGNFSTPMNELYYEDIGPVRAMTDANVGGKKTTSETEDIAPVVAKSAITDAPIREDIAPVAEQKAESELQDETAESYSETPLEAIQTELNNLEELREDAFANFEQKIADKQAELDSKKNKDTKVANNLKMQIERLKRLRDSTDADYSKRISTLETREKLMREGKPTTRQEHHNNIVENVKSEFNSKGFDFDEVLNKAKNLSTFSTVDNTPQRVMEKALGYKEGQVLADLTVNKVAQNETEGIKWLNSFTDSKTGLLAELSKQYDIKPGSKKSAAAQMYAEGFYVNKANEIVEYGDAELAQDFPDIKVRNNIKGLAGDPRIRRIYDETLAAINESRTRNAYSEIPRLDNYFLHFRAMEDTFSRLGLPFNPNDIRAKDLPTDLNGVTADLKPGQPYFASAMHRTGKRTSFDLLGGLERYLTSAKNQIYHIDDIQTLRALRNYIADSYGQAKGLESLDTLSEEEIQERIKQVYDSHLSTFAKFLNEEANVIAGKIPLIDRGLEGEFGRRAITFLDTVNKQVGSNMVGFNVSSSLTNFLPVAQTFAKSNKFDFTKAFAQTVANKFGSLVGKGDSFAEDSPVIIRRKGAERFYRTPYQKIGDTGYVLMSAVDNISTELIARTKYNELTRKGMDSQQAHFETDKWVSRLMGDRSLGQQPQLYNSKMLGIFTKFQLEVRNQLDSQFYDTIQEAKVSNEHIENALARNARTAAKVTSTFFQLAVVQHLFGVAFEAVAGYNPAFDIISVLATVFGFDDDEESEDTVLDNIGQGFLELLEDLPYTSVFTGGRVPISSALPIKEVITGKDEYGNEKAGWETALEAAPYYVLPTGYGQIKKTKAGLEMFSDEHPVAGSYTDSGNLRFPVEDTLINRIQAGVFGQYANEHAREYFDNDYAPLKENQIPKYMASGIPYMEYRKYTKDISGIEAVKDENGKSISGSKKEKVIDYINNLDIDYGSKIILIKSEYPSDDTYNEDIINYINNREDLGYEDRVAIFTELGFTMVGDTVYPD